MTEIVLQTLRDAGVKRMVFRESGEPLEVEFFPLEAKREAVGPSMPKTLSLGAPEMCRCGHDELSHNSNGLCTEGCDVERCAEVQQ